MHEQQAFAHRHTDVVGELHGRRTSAAFLAVDDDEVREDAGFKHRFGDAHEFPRMAQAKLEAHRFAAGQFTQLLNEVHQFDRRGKCAVPRRRDAIFAHQYAAGFGDFFGDLVLGQDPAMTGLGALAHLDFDHPHLRGLRLCRKAFRVEAPVGGAAAEVAAAQFPGQVATVFPVVGADAAFARVVGEVAELGALVQCANGVGAQRTETHGRDVEHRRRVRLGALRAADNGSKTARVAQGSRAHRMADELETRLIHIDQRAEGFVGALVLGARIDQRTLGPGEGQGVAVGFEQVLADLRANALHQVADVAEDRVIAAHRVGALQQIEQAYEAKDAGDGGDRPEPVVRQKGQAGESEDHASGKEGVAAQE